MSIGKACTDLQNRSLSISLCVINLQWKSYLQGKRFFKLCPLCPESCKLIDYS